MTDKRLLERVGQLGFPMLESDDVYETLAEVVKTRDLRLWEAFPVLLANAFQYKNFNYEAIESHLNKPAEKKRLAQLIQMSLALYKSMHQHFSWVQNYYRELSTEQKENILFLIEKIREDKDLSISNSIMSGQRLKEIFKNYYSSSSQPMLGEYLAAKDDMGLEYALSQIFTPRQKELVFKKLKGEKLTKTEKEYYSRTVKKKLSALANPDIHRLAQRIIQ